MVAHAQLAADFHLAQRPADTKAPIAQIVMICHSPPSRSGANVSPFEWPAGAIEISHGFQVPCRLAPYRISSVPSIAKKMVVTPKKPT
jgi:hypothetical protein